MTRKTSSYLLLVPSEDPNRTLDELVAKHKDFVPIETTAVYSGLAGLRFRCSTNDILAMDIARQIADGQEFTLRTGYGVNQRDVGSS